MITDDNQWREKLVTELETAILETGERMLRWFRFQHLPVTKQQVSAQYCLVAVWTVRNIKAGPERTVALRKVLEGKDAAVRASMEE